MSFFRILEPKGPHIAMSTYGVWLESNKDLSAASCSLDGSLLLGGRRPGLHIDHTRSGSRIQEAARSPSRLPATPETTLLFLKQSMMEHLQMRVYRTCSMIHAQLQTADAHKESRLANCSQRNSQSSKVIIALSTEIHCDHNDASLAPVPLHWASPARPTGFSTRIHPQGWAHADRS